MDESPRYRRTAEVIRLLRARDGRHVGIDELAREVGVAPDVVGRDFRRLVGIGPKRFQQDLAARRAVGLLDRGADVLDASLEAGLSGPGRLHDVLVRVEALSPGEWKRRAAGLHVGWGVGASPFGPVAVVWTPRGIHRLEFLTSDEAAGAFAVEARRQLPAAEWMRDDGHAGDLVAAAFALDHEGNFTLDLVATPFQLAVWRALLRLPTGATTSYRTVAEALDRPTATRAVAAAVAANPVAVLIPCHRVLRADGGLAGYRWGLARKLGLLCAESPQPAARTPEGGRP